MTGCGFCIIFVGFLERQVLLSVLRRKVIDLCVQLRPAACFMPLPRDERDGEDVRGDETSCHTHPSSYAKAQPKAFIRHRR